MPTLRSREDECLRVVRVGQVRGQLLDHEPGQPDRAPAGPGLGRPDVQHAPDLNHDLGHLDRPTQQVDAAAAQPGQLPDAQPAVGGDQDQRAVARADRVGQGGDLGRGQEPHLLPLHLGQRHPPTRRLREHPGIHRGAHDLAEELVGLLHRRRRQPSAAQLGHPGAHVALADRGQRSIAEPGQGSAAAATRPAPRSTAAGWSSSPTTPPASPGTAPAPSAGSVQVPRGLSSRSRSGTAGRRPCGRTPWTARHPPGRGSAPGRWSCHCAPAPRSSPSSGPPPQGRELADLDPAGSDERLHIGRRYAHAGQP